METSISPLSPLSRPSLALRGAALTLCALFACGGDPEPAGDTVAPVDTAEPADTGDTAEPADTDATDVSEPELLLHVPSPDWREQVIYFVFTDRFADGDPSNNDQGANEYDPSTNAKYSGGDLQGVIDRLDYIQGLGATAVWITPPVKNQWWDPRMQFGGYHGYWARHFMEVDEHLGDLATYQRLSDALHRRGMYLIQDIVPNHVGNYFTYTGPYDPDDPAKNFSLNTASVPTAAPEQAPFHLNDAADAEHRAAAIYHWTPLIADYNDPAQEKTWQLSDLDDLNTANPVVRDALRESFGHWIREVGVDGFRVDTVKFVEHAFWHDFIHGDDPDAPGVYATAAATGRDAFFAFGEVFETSLPFDDAGEVKVASYLGTPDAPELTALLAFPLYEELKRVVAGGDPTAQLTYRLERFMDPARFPDPHLSPTFLDNHDVQRFLASGTVEALEQALTLLMTLPGVPVIYQGTEQGFTETRAAMFAGGWMSGGVDHFDPEAPLYALIRELTRTRADHRALTHGDLTVLRDTPSGPGAFVFRRVHEGDAALVLLNTAETPVLIADLQTGLDAGRVLDAPSALRVAAPPAHVGEGGGLLLELPGRGALVLTTTAETVTPPAPSATITVTTPIAGEVFSEDTAVEGVVDPPTTALVMVVDDRLAGATPVEVDASGAFTAVLPISTFPYGDTPHTVTFYAAAAGVASERFAFTSSTVFDGQILTFDDPVGDDAGPLGTYTYPTDASFASNASMDIERLVVEAGATTLRLRFTMGDHSVVWNPSNGFDHVAFTIYFDVPGADGITLLPKINGQAPEGFAWDFTHFAFGWANAAYKAEGASETSWGGAVPGRPSIAVAAASRTITFEYDAARFGLSTWEGVSVYATTWDFDGIDNIYRPLTPAGGPWSVGGGEPTDPLIMDDLGPIAIPVVPPRDE